MTFESRATIFNASQISIARFSRCAVENTFLFAPYFHCTTLLKLEASYELLQHTINRPLRVFDRQTRPTRNHFQPGNILVEIFRQKSSGFALKSLKIRVVNSTVSNEFGLIFHLWKMCEGGLFLHLNVHTFDVKKNSCNSHVQNSIMWYFPFFIIFQAIFHGKIVIISQFPNSIAERWCVTLRIFQRSGLKLDKDLIFSGLIQNVYVYRMAKSKKIWPFHFYAIKFYIGKKCMGSYGSSEKWR